MGDELAKGLLSLCRDSPTFSCQGGAAHPSCNSQLTALIIVRKMYRWGLIIAIKIIANVALDRRLETWRVLAEGLWQLRQRFLFTALKQEFEHLSRNPVPLYGQ